jgi:hypothetical protein
MPNAGNVIFGFRGWWNMGWAFLSRFTSTSYLVFNDDDYIVKVYCEIEFKTAFTRGFEITTG